MNCGAFVQLHRMSANLPVNLGARLDFDPAGGMYIPVHYPRNCHIARLDVPDDPAVGCDNQCSCAMHGALYSSLHAHCSIGIDLTADGHPLIDDGVARTGGLGCASAEETHFANR